MKNKDFTPLIMWFFLVTGIIVLSFIRSSRMLGVWNEHPVNLDAVFIGFYILWMLIELRVSGRDVNTEGKKTSDFATCQLYGFGPCPNSNLWFPGRTALQDIRPMPDDHRQCRNFDIFL